MKIKYLSIIISFIALLFSSCEYTTMYAVSKYTIEDYDNRSKELNVYFENELYEQYKNQEESKENKENFGKLKKYAKIKSFFLASSENTIDEIKEKIKVNVYHDGICGDCAVIYYAYSKYSLSEFMERLGEIKKSKFWEFIDNLKIKRESFPNLYYASSINTMPMFKNKIIKAMKAGLKGHDMLCFTLVNIDMTTFIKRIREAENFARKNKIDTCIDSCK